ncbi:PKD domain-containing protein [Halobellus marinus]|uniref:PKD domain-containing protein n=1 Tax=Halobellus TaxID=1073986 RepID=UPI0028A91A4E|nr:PKD domain-containing protein [Halobellus sp. DFY28]
MTTSSVTTILDSSEDVEFDVGETGSYELVPVTFGIGVGVSVNVAIQDGGNAGSDADIDITATGDDFSFQATRNFVIPASSAVKEIKPTVTASGNSGKFEFELENTGSVTVTLTEIGVVQTTNNNVVKVGGKNNDPIFENVTTGNSIVNNVITVGGSRQPLTTTVDLAPGANNAITFEFDRFRDGQNKNGAMSGEDVRISVGFSDGSSTTLDLCIGSCDFASTPTPTSTPTDTPTTTGTATSTPPSNQPPTAAFTSSRKGNSSNVDLDASSSSDPDGSINSYEWDIGANGTVDQTGQTISAKVSPGTEVTLTVTDNDGASASVTKTVN